MARIEIRSDRSDPDLVWLGIRIEDATLCFDTQLWAGNADLAQQAVQLDRFRDRIGGGEHDLRFGAFGPDYAAGAFHAYFAFREMGRLYITVRAQTGFVAFGGRQVANEVTMQMGSEAGLLDEFARSLLAVSEGTSELALLEGTGAIW